MDPSFRSDKPGKSPMGMDLVPVYSEPTSDIVIAPGVVNSLSVKIGEVKRGRFVREIQGLGYVTADENLIEHIHTYTDGWIRELVVKRTGEEVSEEALLFRLFSPKVVNAEEELLLALKRGEEGLVAAARQKLATFGMSEGQIEKIVESKKVEELVDVHAKNRGIVAEINVREGMYVKPDIDVMTIEDLRRIWVIVEVFERQANLVKKGQKVRAIAPFAPSKSWYGEVDYVYPRLDPKTHTLQVRIVFDNPELALKPDMFVNATIVAESFNDVLLVPSSALIRTGREDRLVLSLGEGRFRSVAVEIGEEGNDTTVIKKGVHEGDKIVTSAQFLIDSESNLKAGLDRIEGNKSPPTEEKRR